MQSPVIAITTLLVIAGPAVISGQAFNLSSAECFNPKEAAGINLYLEWPAINTTDQYCYDNQGTGYEAGQNFINCGGCMKFTCTARPCNERDGSQFKMFWVLESLATQCCQDCEGKIFPPNRMVSTRSMGDRCDTEEQSMCKTSSSSPVGTIEVSYSAANCCLDGMAWSMAGTNILEPGTCSSRTCVPGRPAQWDRQTEFQGGCGCCVYQSALVLPGECHQLPDGREACCCEGEMVVTLDQSPQEQATAEMTAAEMTTAEMTAAEMTTVEMITAEMIKAEMIKAKMTTAEMTTAERMRMTTAQMTTAEMTTAEMTTAERTTAEMTAAEMTTAERTTAEMTTVEVTTAEMTTAEMTTAEMTPPPVGPAQALN